MDPHGADQRGNPIGGLLYSQAFGGNVTQGQNSTAPWTQVMQWCVVNRLRMTSTDVDYFEKAQLHGIGCAVFVLMTSINANFDFSVA